MNLFKIASVTMNALKDDLQHNLDVHLQYIEEASQAGCALVVFPELSVTAHYGDPAVTQFAQKAKDGPVHSLMAEQAKKHDIVIGYGYCESARGTFYNTYSLMGPKGFQEIGESIIQRSRYAIDVLSKLPGVKVFFPENAFK